MVYCNKTPPPPLLCNLENFQRQKVKQRLILTLKSKTVTQYSFHHRAIDFPVLSPVHYTFHVVLHVVSIGKSSIFALEAERGFGHSPIAYL